jgi:hypothetical protein
MKSIVLGGTGSVGRHLVQFMVNSPKYETIFLPVKNILPEWSLLSPDKKEKIKIIEILNLDFLIYPTAQLVQYFGNEKIHSLFNCLGEQAPDMQTFMQVDKIYANRCIDFCERMNIDHFSMISTSNASIQSNSLYQNLKWQIEEEALKSRIKYVDIYKPNQLEGKDNAEIMERFYSCVCCCIDGTHVFELAKAMTVSDVLIFSNNINGEQNQLTGGYKRQLNPEQINYLATYEKNPI